MEAHVDGYRLLQPAAVARPRGPEAGAVPDGSVGGPLGGLSGGSLGGVPRGRLDGQSGGAETVRVWRAERESDGRAVAVKVFPPDLADRANREAELTGALVHPHVVPLLDIVTGPDGVGVVFDWFEGGSLADLLDARLRLRWPEALTVLIPLADALTVAHERGLVHGDLTPANVLFDGSGRPALADFGAARAAVECGGEVCATPTDVAPEIVRGAAPSPAADLFSLGSVALACLTGSGAWPADDLQDVMIQSTAGQWPDISDLMAPAAFCALVRRLLAPEPTERGSAAGVAVELRSIGDPEPVALAMRVDPRDAAASVRPATVVRPDAVRPPSSAGRVTPNVGRWRAVARGVTASLSWRGAVAAALVAVLAVGAVVIGRWWGAGPAAAALPAPAVAALAVTGTASDIAVPTASAGVAASSSPAVGLADAAGATDASGTGGEGEGAVAAEQAEVDWMGVVTRLDQARGRALTERDIRLLDDVYVHGSPARSADEERIATLLDARMVPSAATHEIRSASVVAANDDGSVSVAVTETLPPMVLRPQSGGPGTAEIGASDVQHLDGGIDAADTVVLRLVTTADGFRIDRIDRA